MTAKNEKMSFLDSPQAICLSLLPANLAITAGWHNLRWRSSTKSGVYPILFPFSKN